MNQRLTLIQLIIFLLVPFISSCQSIKVNTSPISHKIDQYASEMLDNHSIPGIAIGVIKDGSLIHKAYYGKESLTTNKALSDETVFKVYSLTKTFVATSIFQLIEEGKINLMDSLSSHFDGLLTSWMGVTIGNLLSHSSGLPDIRKLTDVLADDSVTDYQLVKMLYNDEMEFATNEQWNYNQTNYILLKMLIEKVTDTKFEDYILNHQFPKSDRKKVFFSSDPSNNYTNQASYYNYDKTTESFIIKKGHSGKKNHPLAGMNLTLDAYIQWNHGLDNNEHTSNTTKMSMWTPFKFTKTDRHFLYGWDVYDVNGFDSYGFSGGGVSGFRKFVDKDLTIIVLTTGYKNYSVQDLMIDYIAGAIDSTLYNEAVALTEKIMGTYVLTSPISDYSKIVAKVIQENPQTNLEEIFKSIGFTLFFQMDRKQEAIELFKLNVLEYPNSYDTHGSLGYLYFLTEKYKEAREHYSKALELNPENTYSDRRIKEIDSILKG